MRGTTVTNRYVSYRGTLVPGLRRPLLGGQEVNQKLNAMTVLGSSGGLVIERNTELGRKLEKSMNSIMHSMVRKKIEEQTIPLSVEEGVYNLWLKHSGPGDVKVRSKTISTMEKKDEESCAKQASKSAWNQKDFW